jgi:cysteinyl-tRNA synthetase
MLMVASDQKMNKSECNIILIKNVKDQFENSI